MTERIADEEHRLGHAPIWEMCSDGINRACKLCGFIEYAGEKCVERAGVITEPIHDVTDREGRSAGR